MTGQEEKSESCLQSTFKSLVSLFPDVNIQDLWREAYHLNQSSKRKAGYKLNLI